MALLAPKVSYHGIFSSKALKRFPVEQANVCICVKLLLEKYVTPNANAGKEQKDLKKLRRLQGIILVTYCRC